MQILPLGVYNNKQYNRTAVRFSGRQNLFETASKYIREGNIKAITELPDVFILNQEMQSFLHVASRENQVEIAQHFINRGIPVNMQDKQKETPVFLAKTLEMLKMFNKNQADLNKPNIFGKTPIFRYIIQDNFELVQEAINNGAKVNILDASERLPITYAKSNKIRKLLLDNNTSPNVKDPEGFSLLHKAVFEDDYELAELLMDYQPNIGIKDKKNHRPLYYVSNPEMRELLLKNGGNPNEDLYLHYSLMRQDINGLIQFLYYGSNPNAIAPNGRTPAFFASIPEELLLLAEYKANLNFQDPEGNTVLHKVSMFGQQKLIETLKQLGVSETLKNKKGQTAQDLYNQWEKYNFWIK